MYIIKYTWIKVCVYILDICIACMHICTYTNIHTLNSCTPILSKWNTPNIILLGVMQIYDTYINLRYKHRTVIIKNKSNK